MPLSTASGSFQRLGIIPFHEEKKKKIDACSHTISWMLSPGIITIGNLSLAPIKSFLQKMGWQSTYERS